MIRFGHYMIFPDAWGQGPPDPPEEPDESVNICSRCGWEKGSKDGCCNPGTTIEETVGI